MFVETDEGLIAVTKVTRVTGPAGKEVVYWEEGGARLSASLKYAEWGDIMRNTILNMVSALPGTYALWFGVDENGDFYFDKTPVVAWAHAMDGEVYSVTADGVNDGSIEPPCILHPSDIVTKPASGQWKSLEKWKLWAEQVARKEAAEKAAAREAQPA